ncbi:hypothetical protein CLCR_09179 [Cladophialophora carrionii]|uniref:Carrier domain-containing protein n=1 Tax=Cladophialophora carrionii TaxID=86049 RepID=A0A1C1CTG5_9EURO|nr:hypothetical protein CLCR_09179 [Cladophialophora carrionii]
MIIASDEAAAMQSQDLIDALWPTIMAENKPLPTYPELREFLHVQILDPCPHDDDSVLTDDIDMFSLYGDSLQPTRLRDKILKEFQMDGNTLPQMVVFKYPSIAKLATAMINIRDHKSIEVSDSIE